MKAMYSLITPDGKKFIANQFLENHEFFIWYQNDSDLDSLEKLKPETQVQLDNEYMTIEELSNKIGRYVMPRPTILNQRVGSVDELFAICTKDKPKLREPPRLLDLLNAEKSFEHEKRIQKYWEANN